MIKPKKTSSIFNGVNDDELAWAVINDEAEKSVGSSIHFYIPRDDIEDESEDTVQPT